MLKHNPKLKKLYDKAVKRESKTLRGFENEAIEVLDMRYKTSQEYLKAFREWIQSELKYE